MVSLTDISDEMATSRPSLVNATIALENVSLKVMLKSLAIRQRTELIHTRILRNETWNRFLQFYKENKGNVE